eukprot:gene24657-10283_t
MQVVMALSEAIRAADEGSSKGTGSKETAGATLPYFAVIPQQISSVSEEEQAPPPLRDVRLIHLSLAACTPLMHKRATPNIVRSLLKGSDCVMMAGSPDDVSTAFKVLHEVQCTMIKCSPDISSLTDISTRPTKVDLSFQLVTVGKLLSRVLHPNPVKDAPNIIFVSGYGPTGKYSTGAPDALLAGWESCGDERSVQAVASKVMSLLPLLVNLFSGFLLDILGPVGQWYSTEAPHAHLPDWESCGNEQSVQAVANKVMSLLPMHGVVNICTTSKSSHLLAVKAITMVTDSLACFRGLDVMLLMRDQDNKMADGTIMASINFTLMMATGLDAKLRILVMMATELEPVMLILGTTEEETHALRTDEWGNVGLQLLHPQDLAQFEM